MAAEIDDRMGNVAQGMVNIGQLWATAPSRRDTHARNGADRSGSDVQPVALFTNPPGVDNTFSGTWNAIPGYVWNGKYWYEPRGAEGKRTSASTASTGLQHGKQPAAQQKRKREDSSDDEAAGKPKPRKL
ncbi:hypothetical protein PI126_g17292 [Phytophthora idaei]|nr:hypothetical protein PI126_g17292 [Phytophthora idaei]